MKISFQALPTNLVRALQDGGADANGAVPERTISDGLGNPCRHCLKEVPEGEEMLILAYRPFPEVQPYAEVGPIFLCAKHCERHADSESLPEMFASWERILVRGYTEDNRIKYGTGQVIPMKDVEQVAEKILADDEISYVHMRSSSNNCYQCRVERG